MADKFRRKREPRHIRLYASMTSTLAWFHLSGNGQKVLTDLVSIDDGTRNGEIAYSYRHASERTGLAPNTCRAALRELQDKGFIACTVRGAFSRKVRHASLWRYTWQAATWPDGKSPPTRDFERWKPDDGKSRHQKLNATAPNFALETETPTASVSDFGAEPLETPLVSVFPLNANIGALSTYQGMQADRPETDQRKQANSCERPDLAFLRNRLIEHLERAEPGEQSSLASRLDIPGGTLSKFINGKGLPERHVAALAHALRSEAA